MLTRSPVPHRAVPLLTWCLVCGCALSLFGGCTCTSLCIVPMGVGWGQDKDNISHSTAAHPPPRAPQPSNLWTNMHNIPKSGPDPSPTSSTLGIGLQ